MTMDGFIEVKEMTQSPGQQKIRPKAPTKKLIESVRRDLHRLVIEMEGLIAVASERAKLKEGRAGE